MAKLSVIAFLLLSTLLAVANGDYDAATPTTICNVKVSELVVCIPAITGKSPPWPTKGCCSVMQKANLKCFCNYKAEFVKFGVDPVNAIALPKKCGLRVPGVCKK